MLTKAMEVLDRLANGTPYESLAKSFLEFERPSGNDPLLLAAEAAASTTGQQYVTGIRPTVEQFRETFLETGRVDSFEALAAIDPEDNALTEVFGAERKRHVLGEIARVLTDCPEDDDLEALRGWAAEADVYRYEADPIGSISGVGPATFQYLRQLAGIDTAKPDPNLEAFIERVAADLEDSPLDTKTPLRTLASCEWLSLESSYGLLELDQLAWWLFTDPDERAAALESA